MEKEEGNQLASILIPNPNPCDNLEDRFVLRRLYVHDGFSTDLNLTPLSRKLLDISSEYFSDKSNLQQALENDDKETIQRTYHEFMENSTKISGDGLFYETLKEDEYFWDNCFYGVSIDVFLAYALVVVAIALPFL